LIFIPLLEVAKIGFQQKISPFLQPKQYLKYLTGCLKFSGVIKGEKQYPPMSQPSYAGPHLLIGYVVVYKEWLHRKIDQGF
jgi:hypothetical protein